VEPDGAPERAPPVLRLRVLDAAHSGNFADFRLFRGALSTYHLGRLRQRDLPNTLLEREVPSAVWGEGADVIVAPAQSLPDGPLALASSDLGLLAEVTVDSSLVTPVERRWPPAERRVGRGPMIFCGAGASGVVATPVTLDPAAVTALVQPGLGGDTAAERNCVRLEPTEDVPDGALVFPPLAVDGLAFEPRPLVVASTVLANSGCAASERTFGPSCVSVEDDRARFRAPDAPSFWVLREPVERLFTLEPGRSVTVRGLEPGRLSRFAATVFDLSGRSESLELEVLAAGPMPHLVINEVLANPIGAERQSEWLELVNDGERPVEVGGFELRDATGGATLPETVLGPGELALVVAEDFAPDGETDLVAPQTVKRLVVPALGSGGLANGGEPLRLLDREGQVVSRFPAIAATKPGQSVARVSPEAPDGEPGAFGPHAEPGASPGLPNVVAEDP
jgi:hypothetical protein